VHDWACFHTMWVCIYCPRFVCRQRLGGRKGEPAAYLTPVPPNAVVYGTGDAARIISKVGHELQEVVQVRSTNAVLSMHILPGVVGLVCGPHAALHVRITARYPLQLPSCGRVRPKCYDLLVLALLGSCVGQLKHTDAVHC
jgi:hypothetical protein